MSAEQPLLELRGVAKHFPVRRGLIASLINAAPRIVRALDQTDLTLVRGRSLGIVGESGCGKTTLAKTILRLHAPSRGQVLFAGDDLAALRGDALRRFRRNVQLIFQDPFESLDPRYTVGQTLEEPLRVHRIGSRQERRDRVAAMLETMGLATAGNMADRYPHELSGGQRQRVAIGRALITDPALVVADEPVSMLDVSIRAGLIETLLDQVRSGSRASIYISHDLSIIRQMCETTAVMYLGRIVEIGPTETIIGEPTHPYTRALLDAVPVPDPDHRLKLSIGGGIPDATELHRGCAFYERCPERQARCRDSAPVLESKSSAPGVQAACHERR